MVVMKLVLGPLQAGVVVVMKLRERLADKNAGQDRIIVILNYVIF